MKHLVSIVGMLAVTFMPVVASATAHKHHRATHDKMAHYKMTHYGFAPRSVQDAYGTTALQRIPSLDPPECDSPNVVTIEHCRASSNGDK